VCQRITARPVDAKQHELTVCSGRIAIHVLKRRRIVVKGSLLESNVITVDNGKTTVILEVDRVGGSAR